MQSQTFHYERKVSAWLKYAPFAKNSQTWCQLLGSRVQTAEIEDFQDLMNLRLCFQLTLPGFNVGLYPLGATAAASEIWIRRQEKASSQYGGGDSWWGGWEQRKRMRWGWWGRWGGVHVSLWASLDVCGSKEWVERCREEGLEGGASKGLEIVAVFQKQTPRRASISNGVRNASPLAPHGAWAPHQSGINAGNTV